MAIGKVGIGTAVAGSLAIGSVTIGSLGISLAAGSAPPAAPANVALPAITGSATVGQTLTCSTGTWSGSPTSYAYQWAGAGTPIGGATSSTYVPVSGDIGNTLTCTVTATNGGGSASATSLATLAVSAGAPAAIVLPTPSFGSTNLLAWWDVTKTDGNSNPLTYSNSATGTTTTFAQTVDLTGNGYDLGQPDKSLQPIIGANGGPVTSANGAQLFTSHLSLLNGLTQVSWYGRIKPRSDLYSGAVSRKLFSVSEGATSAILRSATLSAAGTGYAPNDYITLTGGTSSIAAIIRVDTITGGGGTGPVGTFTVIQPGKYTVVPSNPVAQGSVINPAGSSTGTGATFTCSFTDIGTGAVRFGVQMSGGTSGRKVYSQVAAHDGAQHQTSTSLGPQLANDVFNALGVEIDFTGAVNTGLVTASFYLNGTLSYTETWTPAEASPWAFGTADSISFVVGDSGAAAPDFCEIEAMLFLSEIPTSTRRGQINTYFSGLAGT